MGSQVMYHQGTRVGKNTKVGYTAATCVFHLSRWRSASLLHLNLPASPLSLTRVFADAEQLFDWSTGRLVDWSNGRLVDWSMGRKLVIEIMGCSKQLESHLNAKISALQWSHQVIDTSSGSDAQRWCTMQGEIIHFDAINEAKEESVFSRILSPRAVTCPFAGDVVWPPPSPGAV